MSKVRQLPQLYLRGALTNITMKNLTPEQHDEVAKITKEIINNPIMTGHRNKFSMKLQSTISADYNGDTEASKQDYYVAVWRGVVYLLYHHDYILYCGNCSQQKYASKQGKNVMFNRLYDSCPYCNCTIIDDPGDSHYTSGSYANIDSVTLTAAEIQDKGGNQPTVKSPILYKQGAKKIPNAREILNDKDQLKKFFGQFIWNYFKQTLNENSITTHKKTNNTEVGPADMLLSKAIYQVVSSYLPQSSALDTHTDRNYYKICCNPNLLPLHAIRRILELKNSINADVTIKYDDSGIYVYNMHGSSPMVELKLPKEEVVTCVGNVTETNNNESVDLISQIENINDDDIDKIDLRDKLTNIRATLPPGPCRTVFDLLSGQGIAYGDFVKMYPEGYNRSTGLPRKSAMAAFIKCSAKELNHHKQTIKMALLTSR